MKITKIQQARIIAQQLYGLDDLPHEDATGFAVTKTIRSLARKSLQDLLPLYEMALKTIEVRKDPIEACHQKAEAIVTHNVGNRLRFNSTVKKMGSREIINSAVFLDGVQIGTLSREKGNAVTHYCATNGAFDKVDSRHDALVALIEMVIRDEVEA